MGVKKSVHTVSPQASKWRNRQSNVIRRKKSHGFKSVRQSKFIHSIHSIHSIYFRKQTDKQAKKTSKQLPEGRWADRSTTTDRPPTIDDDRPPTIDDRRRRSTTMTSDRYRYRRPTHDRPSMIDDARSLFSATVNRHMKSYIQTTPGNTH